MFGVPAEDSLEAFYSESLHKQQQLTDQLGLQVRLAVETLVRAIDRIDDRAVADLIEAGAEKEIYEAALTVMMRLLFLLYAEEQSLLPLGEALYGENYAASTLLDRLMTEADRMGTDVLERRKSAWARLLATFRAVHAGLDHDQLSIPAHGGALFDPDRFPFLEGRASASRWRDDNVSPPAIDDLTVLTLLRAIQYLEIGGRSSEARRLSFKELGIEQIGHVYESLLDHKAKRADEPVLSLLGKRGEEPKVTISELEAWRDAGTDSFVGQLKKATGRTKRAIETALAAPSETDDPRWAAVCGGDRELLERLKPFANLIRRDEHGYPYVIRKGSVYVTAGTDRRNTGTHYTPPSLTEPIVKYTLEPLVYIGPAEGLAQEEWKLKSPRELLELKVCDMAVGSGAFLVQACRYLSERLIEGWEEIEAANSGRVVVTPEGKLSTGDPSERPIPKNAEERFAIARRAIADRCLYGVDRNPMAIEMAKLSIWLITLQRGRPFEFLDHAIKCGDALLGCDAIVQVKNFHMFPERGQALFGTGDFFDDIVNEVERAVATASSKRRELETFEVIDIRDADSKERLNKEAEQALDVVRLVGDAVVAASIANANSDRAMDDAIEGIAPEVARVLGRISAGLERISELRDRVQGLLDEGKPKAQPPRRCFHWVLEFPEVFGRENPGFDALVGNPPFQGGKKITGEHGTDYRNYLVSCVADGRKGSADLCAYFFLRGQKFIRDQGGFGFLATNTIAQGDTREVGLSKMVETGTILTRAVQSRRWPGAANLEISHVWGYVGEWKNGYVLDDLPVKGITSYLARPGRVEGDPYRLKTNLDRSFIGSIVLGKGYVLESSEAIALMRRNPENKKVLFQYLNGEDLNSRPDQSPSRWVINFHDWPLSRSASGRWRDATKKHQNQWIADGRVPEDYPGPVAADFPECLSIVEEKVKPVRAKNKRKAYRERWWQYAEKQTKLRAAISKYENVLARSRVSNLNSIALCKSEIIFSEATVVFTSDDFGMFSLLQSSLHTLWLEKQASSMRTDIRYSPSDCMDTFPFPEITQDMKTVGNEYENKRRKLLEDHQIGLTALYKEMHYRSSALAGIDEVRKLHRENDIAVVCAYGWEIDLDMQHDFYETPRGMRYTLDDNDRAKILDRLLALNHERYAEEVAQGLHDRGAGKSRKKRGIGSPLTSAKSGNPQLRMGF